MNRISLSVAESARIARFQSSVSRGHFTLPLALNWVPGKRTRERSRPSVARPTTWAIESLGSLLSVASRELGIAALGGQPQDVDANALLARRLDAQCREPREQGDRKSTRLNSSHVALPR